MKPNAYRKDGRRVLERVGSAGILQASDLGVDLERRKQEGGLKPRLSKLDNIGPWESRKDWVFVYCERVW